jgi:hypothetical protein
MAIPFDLIAIIVVLIFFLAGIIFFGKSAGISVIFALPISTFLYSTFPYKEQLITLGNSPIESESFKIGVFILFLILSYVVIRRAVSVVFPWGSISKIAEALIISLIITGLLSSLLANYIDVQIVSTYLPILNKLLALPNIIFWWFSGSLLTLLFILNK